MPAKRRIADGHGAPGRADRTQPRFTLTLLALALLALTQPDAGFATCFIELRHRCRRSMPSRLDRVASPSAATSAALQRVWTNRRHGLEQCVSQQCRRRALADADGPADCQHQHLSARSTDAARAVRRAG